MAMNEDFERDTLSGGSFSQLLGSNDVLDFDMTESLFYPSSSFPPSNSPTMLCFETPCKETPAVVATVPHKQKQNHTNSDGGGGDQSCSASSTNNSTSSGTTKSKSKKSQSEEDKIEQQRRHSGAPNPESKGETKKPSKKQKTVTPPTLTRPVKVRKEKLGERVTALQQLVSPFGKTDTASVLHEAMGYIRFLHDQVQVLSSPYLQSMPSSAHQDGRGEGENRKEVKCDLRSRGLCLVPVEYTQQVTSSNGADFWSPVMGSNNNNNNNNSSLVKH